MPHEESLSGREVSSGTGESLSDNDNDNDGLSGSGMQHDDRSTSFSFVSAAFSFFGHRQNQGDENGNDNGNGDDLSSSIFVPVTVPVGGHRRPSDNGGAMRGDDDDDGDYSYHSNDVNDNDDNDDNNDNDNIRGRGSKKDDIYLESFRRSRAELGAMDTTQRSTTSLSSTLYSPKSCPICLEKYEVGDEIAWSKNDQCLHAFHLDCILDWLMDHDQCPLCREGYL